MPMDLTRRNSSTPSLPPFLPMPEIPVLPKGRCTREVDHAIAEHLAGDQLFSHAEGPREALGLDVARKAIARVVGMRMAPSSSAKRWPGGCCTTRPAERSNVEPIDDARAGCLVD